MKKLDNSRYRTNANVCKLLYKRNDERGRQLYLPTEKEFKKELNLEN